MAFLGALIEAIIKMAIVAVFALGGILLGKRLLEKKEQKDV